MDGTLGDIKGENSTENSQTKSIVDPPPGLSRLERVRFLLNQDVARRVQPMNRQIVLAYFGALEPDPEEMIAGLPPLPPLGMEREIRIIFNEFPRAVRDRLIRELDTPVHLG